MSQRKAKEYRQAMEQYRGVVEDVDDLKRRIGAMEARHRKEDQLEEISRRQARRRCAAFMLPQPQSMSRMPSPCQIEKSSSCPSVRNTVGVWPTMQMVSGKGLLLSGSTRPQMRVSCPSPGYPCTR